MRPRLIPLPALAGLLALAGCESTSTFNIEPVMVEDTVEVFAPLPQNAGRPTALDISARGTLLSGARFPERAETAGEWDFLVRLRDGQLALVPPGAVGLESQAALTRALAGQTFEGLEEAPPASSFVTDTAVVVRQGEVYAARSRQIAGGFGGCIQYSKLQPLEVDPASGRLWVRVATNQTCSDPRLVGED